MTSMALHKVKDKTTSKTIAMALSTFIVFGAAPAAQAGSRDDGPPASGGYRIGPLGQIMGGPSTWRGRPFNVYAYVPRSRIDQVWQYENDSGALP